MELINTKKELCIIYHFPCYDGAYGAINTYLYYNNFKRNKYNITFKPLRNICPIFSAVDKKYDKIISLDLSLKDEDIPFLTNKENDATSIVIFDHHFSWYEKYIKEYKPKISDRKKLKIIYDEKNTKSACGLSLNYYKSKCKTIKDVDEKEKESVFNENLISINNYIEDSDIGRFQIKDIHEFKSALSKDCPMHLSNFSFNYKKRINIFLKINPSDMVQNGKQILMDLKKDCKKILNENWIYIVELKDGIKFLMCITEKKYVRNYACPLLGKISKKRGFLPVGAFVYKYDKGLYKFSMRASDDTCDVSKIAQLYGGGGHKSAAAFIMDYNGIDNLILSTIDVYKDINDTPI